MQATAVSTQSPKSTKTMGFLVIWAISVTLTSTVSLQAQAGSVEETRAAKEAAYGKFYKELLKIDRSNPAAVKALRDSIVTPAQNAANEAQRKSYEAKYPPPKLNGDLDHRDMDPKRREARKKRLEDKLRKGLDAYLISIGKKKGDGKETPDATGPAKKSGGYQPDTGPGRPETTLDGSGISREVEFGGAPKKPTPTPTSGQTVPKFGN